MFAALAQFLSRFAIPIGGALVVGWAALTLSVAVPGWVHALLTTGVFMLIFGVVARGTSHRA
ncbi:MAG TPA: hypothetical protein VGD56_19810 [Gemmatirosa sp.]